MKRFLIIVFFLLTIPLSASALVTYSGNQVSIDEPVNDDVFVTGNMIEINAPVQSVVAAGGTITINAPVKGDIVAAGGTITINDDVGGKVVAVGGNIDLAGNVSTNAVLQGGRVNIRKSVVIGKDATITAGSVHNAGTVMGKLSVQTQDVENSGTAGTYEVKVDRSPGRFLWLFSLIVLLLTIGWYILGLLMIRFVPVRFLQVESEVRINTLVKCAVGFAAIIISVIAFVLLAITIILLPLAIILGVIVFISLVLANLFVASSLGRIIFGYMKWSGKEWHLYTVGFLALCILYIIPVINILTFVIGFSLGFGAILYAVHNNWGAITGSSPS
jgi:acetyltransferase-like isoleucine patch superfamily enzyme